MHQAQGGWEEGARTNTFRTCTGEREGEENDIGLGQLDWSGLKSVRLLVTFIQSALTNVDVDVDVQDADVQLFNGPKFHLQWKATIGE